MRHSLHTFCILTFLLTIGGSIAMSAPHFHAATLVDIHNPVPAEWLKKAGIDIVYTSATFDMELNSYGIYTLPGKTHTAWEAMQAAYADAGIKVLVMSNYYSHQPAGTEAVDCDGRKIDMACLYNDDFYEWMRATIIKQAEAYSAYSIFGGFVFDDGVGSRVDCCYCDTCVSHFRQIYAQAPPAFEPHDGTGIVADDDALLNWDRFHRDGLNRYFAEQSAAVRSVSPDLLMLTIPADSYFCGRLLNANMKRQDLARSASALIQRPDRLQLKEWFIYQTFPFARLPEAGENGLQTFGTGTHITASSTSLVQASEGPHIQHTTRMQMLSPDETAKLARTTITEGANAICYWCSGAYTAYNPDGYDGMAVVARDIEKIENLLHERKPLPAKIGLLYSTTTEIFEQPWRENTAERMIHMHSFEGTAFALLRGNIPCRIIMEEDLTSGGLAGIQILLLPNARFLSESASQAIEQAAANGMQILTCGDCPDIAGAEHIAYDVTYWHRMIQRGYRNLRQLNTQYAEAEKALLPRLRDVVNSPIAIASKTGCSRLYEVPEGIVAMICNWDLHHGTEAIISANGEYEITDALTGIELGSVNEQAPLTLSIGPADWRVLLLK